MVEAENAEVESASTPEDIAIQPKRTRSERYASFYVNQMELGFTNWDIQFSLAQVHGRNDSLVAEELATVLMSPQHAKAVIIPFINTIMQYEAKHGVIQVLGQKSASLADILAEAAVKIKIAKEVARKETEESKV